MEGVKALGGDKYLAETAEIAEALAAKIVEGLRPDWDIAVCREAAQEEVVLGLRVFAPERIVVEASGQFARKSYREARGGIGTFRAVIHIGGIPGWERVCQ